MFTQLTMSLRPFYEMSKVPSKNLLNPFTNAVGHNFPRTMSEAEATQLLDPSGQNIASLNLIRNQLGQATGKVLIEFKDSQSLQNNIKKFHEQYVKVNESLVKLSLIPFKPKVKAEYKKTYDVKLTNIDFQMGNDEIRRFAEDFGQVVGLDFQRTVDGRNKGYGIIMFKEPAQRVKFIQFANGLNLLGRKVKATPVVEKTKAQRKQEEAPERVQVPWTVLERNKGLYNAFVKNSAVSTKSQDGQ